LPSIYEKVGKWWEHKFTLVLGVKLCYNTYCQRDTMALFFNLKVLESQCGTNAAKFIALLEYHHTGRLANKRSKYKPSAVPLTGSSYILNPEPLFEDSSTDILFKVQYIKLAAYRDYSLYKLYKYKALDTSYFPDIKYDAIQHNPLLTITQKEIKFKYEEN